MSDTSVPPATRLTECLAQFLPGSDADTSQLQGWLAGCFAAFGPGKTDHGRAALSALSRHARERVDQWLGILADEGVLRPTDLVQAATIVLAVVNGLSLEVITPGSPVDVDAAHRMLHHIVATTLVGPHAIAPQDRGPGPMCAQSSQATGTQGRRRRG